MELSTDSLTCQIQHRLKIVRQMLKKMREFQSYLANLLVEPTVCGDDVAPSKCNAHGIYSVLG